MNDQEDTGSSPAAFKTLYSWNVNGYRSVSGKTLFPFIEKHKPDILCLQEIKTNAPGQDLLNPFPYQIFHPAEKPGYSGTAILSHIAPISIKTDFPGDHPREGRVITAEFHGCHVVCAYVPNSRDKLVRLDYRLRWDEDFQKHLVSLAIKKPVFICGDLNCAHHEIDLANPVQNHNSAGFTDQERASFATLLACGLRDTFREKNPDARACYSWWSYRSAARARNVGWRIDYWLADVRLDGLWQEPRIHAEITGSDHCPVSIMADASLF